MKNAEMDNTDILQKYFGQATNTNAIAITNEATAPQHPDISVIVPVFNTSLYLKDCLDSLLAQSHDNLEIICINDASSDNSLDILKDYAKKDKRLRVYSFEKNVGVASCRNYALQRACGEYISFVDSDDWLSLDFCEKLYRQAKDDNYDVVKGEVYLSYIDGSCDISHYNSQIADDLKQNKCVATAFYSDFTAALYLHIFLKNVHAKFPELSNGEDIVFLLSVLLHNPKFSLVEDAFYYYRQRQNSVSNSHASSNAMSIFNHFDMLCVLLNNSKIPQSEYMEYFFHRMYRGMLHYYDKILLLNLANQEYVFCLQRVCDILRKCKYQNVLLELCTYPFLKTLMVNDSIAGLDVPLFLKERYLGQRNFTFSYMKYWLRIKISRGKKKQYYEHRYLVCKKIKQLERDFALDENGNKMV